MRGEAVLAHMRVVHQTALDHVPAEQALQPAQDEHGCQARNQRSPDAAADQEIQKREQKHHSDGASQETVRVFEPVNALEAVQVHARVDLLVLRGFSVEAECRIPLRLAERRHDAEDGVPLHHRQPRAGESGHAAEHHHGIDHGAADHQPERQPPVMVGREGPR
jgi:hypothetical protein